MGADLYIRSIQRMVDELFRDLFDDAVDLRDYSIGRFVTRAQYKRLSQELSGDELHEATRLSPEPEDYANIPTRDELLAKVAKKLQTRAARSQGELHEKFVAMSSLVEEMAVLQTASDAVFEDKAQEFVSAIYDALRDHDGYFRDSYNGTNLLWRLGLDYWGHVGSLLNKQGYLTGKNLRAFRAEVATRPLDIPDRAGLEELRVAVDDDENSVESWRQYFTEKRDRLIVFLDRAIARKEGVYCSI